MANVVELEDGQYPPENEPCYIVARDPAGRFYIADPEVGFIRSTQASSIPISEHERSATIQRATDYADKHGVKTVYVVV